MMKHCIKSNKSGINASLNEMVINAERSIEITGVFNHQVMLSGHLKCAKDNLKSGKCYKNNVM